MVGSSVEKGSEGGARACVYWARWCAHCKRLMDRLREGKPEWAKHVSLEFVDCSVDSRGTVTPVRGFPSFVVDGSVVSGVDFSDLLVLSAG